MPSTTLGYTGEQTDPSGLLYLRARYMDPGTGMFLSHDPFGGVASRAMSRNGYSYVEGNSLNHTDPSGMCDDGLDIFQCGLQNLGIVGNVVRDALTFATAPLRSNNLAQTWTNSWNATWGGGLQSYGREAGWLWDRVDCRRGSRSSFSDSPPPNRT